MKVSRNKRGAITIQGLTPGQFAYVVGVLGMSHSLVDSDGRFRSSPVVPDARNLIVPLSLAAAKHDLASLVREVERSQELWRRRTRQDQLVEVAS